MKKILLLSLLAILLINLGACRKKELSSLVDQNQIYQDLSLAYYDGSNITTATARFYEGSLSGSRLELSQDSRTFYNGVELKRTTKRGTNYAVTLNGFVGGANFDWNDSDDRHFVNKADIPASISSYSQTINGWGATFGYDVYFDGDSIGVDEQVILRIDVNQDTTFNIEVTESTQGRRYVHLSSWDVQRLSGFTPSFYLTRRRLYDLSESTTVGGQLWTSYVSTSNWLYIW